MARCAEDPDDFLDVQKVPGPRDAPTLLVSGERDAMIPFRNAQDYLAALPDARLISFADLGHAPHAETPKRALEPV